MQAQYWPWRAGRLSAAYAGNTGRRHPHGPGRGRGALDTCGTGTAATAIACPTRPISFGVRVKAAAGLAAGTPHGRAQVRTCRKTDALNPRRPGGHALHDTKYEPYVQDTAPGAGPYDPIAPSHDPFNPAFMVTDAAGLAIVSLGQADAERRGCALYDWVARQRREIDGRDCFRQAGDTAALGAVTGAPEAALAATLADWETACAAGEDPLGRPPSSLHRLRPPYWVAPVVPVVSNTQGGPVHDAHQRVCDPFGTPIPGLYAAGECGSAFGHLYIVGGAISPSASSAGECRARGPPGRPHDPGGEAGLARRRRRSAAPRGDGPAARGADRGGRSRGRLLRQWRRGGRVRGAGGGGPRQGAGGALSHRDDGEPDCDGPALRSAGPRHGARADRGAP